MRITKAQRRFLVRAERSTLRDGTGRGAMPNDGIETQVAVRLAAKGLVTLPAAWTGFAGAKITEAGRRALAGDRP